MSFKPKKDNETKLGNNGAGQGYHGFIKRVMSTQYALKNVKKNPIAFQFANSANERIITQMKVQESKTSLRLETDSGSLLVL